VPVVELLSELVLVAVALDLQYPVGLWGLTVEFLWDLVSEYEWVPLVSLLVLTLVPVPLAETVWEVVSDPTLVQEPLVETV
jgi:hypothetical protein